MLNDLQTHWREFLIVVSAFFGLVNCVAWIFLIRRQKISLSLKAMAEKLVNNERAFIDPILFMACAAFIAGIALFGTKVTPKKEQECKTVTIIQYVEPDTLKTKPIKVTKPKQKPCEK
jgi:hypothetical protein